LLAVIGVKNSEDMIYQGILESVGRKYPDQTLASLTDGTDTRGLLKPGQRARRVRVRHGTGPSRPRSTTWRNAMA
jgi:hypothetical protein